MRAPRPTYVRNDRFTGDPPGPLPGSREHFFHFLLGYLVPLVHAQEICRYPDFLALDCGPLMTPALTGSLDRLGYRYGLVTPEGIETRHYVEPWDCAWKTLADVRAAAATLREAWADTPCDQTDCPDAENLLIERSPPHPFYEGGGAEIGGYGAARRGVSNWPEVQAYLRDRGIDHALYEPGRHSLACQMASFARARRIAGMRGAEWGLALWSPPGLSVRVLDPSPPAEILSGFFQRTGIDHTLIPVGSPHTAEDARAVAALFQSGAHGSADF